MAAFTTIAAAAGLAATAGTTAMSFAQAGKQRRLQAQAEADAAKAQAEARKMLEINFYEAVSIQKEPYELERQALIAAGAQAIEAGRESERGAAAVAGRVQMAQQEGQAAIRTAMGKELTELEKATAMEESRLRDVGVQLNLEEAAGAQMAAAQAQEAAQKATAEGVQGVTSFIGQAASAVPLFGRNVSQEQAALSQLQLTPEQFQAIGNVPNSKVMGPVLSNGATNLDLTLIPQMSKAEYKDWIGSLNASQKAILFGPQYRKSWDSLYGFNPIK